MHFKYYCRSRMSFGEGKVRECPAARRYYGDSPSDRLPITGLPRPNETALLVATLVKGPYIDLHIRAPKTLEPLIT